MLHLVFFLGGIKLPHREWLKLDGNYGPVEDVGDSSVHILGAHNPIDILSVKLQRIGKIRFRIDLELFIGFESEGIGFANTEYSVSIEADYKGLLFEEPIWSDPESIQYPDNWEMPSVFNKSTVGALFERFVDTSAYILEQNGKNSFYSSTR